MRSAHLSEAGQCIELGPGQDRPSFDAQPAPQLPADHLRRHVDTLCRRSTPAALPRVDFDSTLPAAADMMPVHARLAGGQLCDRAMASKQATPMKEQKKVVVNHLPPPPPPRAPPPPPPRPREPVWGKGRQGLRQGLRQRQGQGRQGRRAWRTRPRQGARVVRPGHWASDGLRVDLRSSSASASS